MTRKNYKSLVKILARNNINFDDHAELIGSIICSNESNRTTSALVSQTPTAISP